MFVAAFGEHAISHICNTSIWITPIRKKETKHTLLKREVADDFINLRMCDVFSGSIYHGINTRVCSYAW